MKNKNLELVGNEEGYQVFRNSDGFMEGYKKVRGGIKVDGDDSGKDIRRVVSNATTIEGFARYVRGLKNRRKIKDVPVKVKDLPQLFNEDF